MGKVGAQLLYKKGKADGYGKKAPPLLDYEGHLETKTPPV